MRIFRILFCVIFLGSATSQGAEPCVQYLDGKTQSQTSNSETEFIQQHLLKAQRFFIELNPSNPFLTQCINVRIQMDAEFNRDSHFSLKTSLNNSITIPAGESWFSPEVEPWPAEIWFQKSATVHPQSKQKLRALDSARSPSAIVHEYAHIAMQEYFPSLYFYYAVPEAFANYFAASIIGKPVILDEEVNNRGYKIKFKSFEPYHRNIDRLENKPTSHGSDKYYFKQVPSLLWRLRQTFGEKGADRIALRALKHLSETSLQIDVVEAIRSAILERPEEFTRRQVLFGYSNLMSWKFAEPNHYPDAKDLAFQKKIKELWPK